MDKIIEKKKWTPKKIIIIILLSLLALLLIYMILFADKRSKYNVDIERITISEVKKDIFQEYINITGNVLPIKTVFLDALEGGRVEQILLEEGTNVKKDDPILKLSNTNLHLSIMNREASLAEQINNLRNTRLLMEQTKLDLKKQLIEINYFLQQSKRNFEQKQRLFDKKFIANDNYLEAKEKYYYYRNKKVVLLESQKQDSLFRNIQIEQLEESVNRMQENLRLVRHKLDNLTVKAPIKGQLASINAEIGEAISQGERLGQINDLSSYKINAEIDEHYISRIHTSLRGSFVYSNQEYNLEVRKIYPEVRNNRFSVDLEFLNSTPENIRIGQSFRIKLELGESQNAVLIPRGAFYQSTGGRYIFVVNKSGNYATKRNIRLGRFNPQFYEVLSGLEVGEQVITSSYETYGDSEKLILKK